jgi:hypothetical protein
MQSYLQQHETRRWLCSLRVRRGCVVSGMLEILGFPWRFLVRTTGCSTICPAFVRDKAVLFVRRAKPSA